MHVVAGETGLTPNSARKQPSVLVVDDMPENIQVLRHILEPQGYRIRAAIGGLSALASARNAPPDIMLLDVMMSDMDGFEVCRRLKGDEATRDIPVVFVTGRNDSQAVVEAFAAGAVDYLTKPVQSEEVCARVQTQLKLREQLQALREQAERFRAVVSNMAEGLLIIEQGGHVQFANPAATYTLGYEPERLEGVVIDTLIAEPGRGEVRDFLLGNGGAQAAGGPAMLGPFEVQLLRADGAAVAMDLTISQMFVTPPLFIGLLHDISRYKLSQDALLQIAYTDPLTNIANRRRMDAFVQQEWRRLARANGPISLVMIDIDHFKPFNDMLGHQAGDRCLQRVAQIVQSVARRPTDLAARYGGEEFVLVFSETEAPVAQHLAEVLRQRIEGIHVPHPGSPTSNWVTASLGVSTIYPSSVTEPEALFRNADAALYQAKAEGRNRVSWGG